ncbi:MAG: hypothetical protein ACPG4X_16905 [Pikeienuella sp.]
MTFREALDSGLQSAVSWLIVGALGGLVWLVRRVFTNQKQIEMLHTALEARDEQRNRDREEITQTLTRIEGTQTELQADVKKLFQRD